MTPTTPYGRDTSTHTSFLVEGGRANGPVLVAVGQDRANDPGDDLTYGQPRPVGVEVVTLTDEALDLHAPSIRMEHCRDVQKNHPNSPVPVLGRFFHV